MYKLSKRDMATMREVEAITGTDYEVDNARIPTEYLMNAIEELLVEINNLQDTIAAMEDDRNENYELKHYDTYRELGLRESDFY